MDLVVYDDEERRYVPWVVTLAAVLLAAVLAAGLTYLLAGGSQDEALGGVGAPQAVEAPSPEGSTTPRSATPGATEETAGSAPTCEQALEQADALVARSTRVGQALGEHTRIMDELLAKRLDAQQALDRTLPVLTTGAKDRDRLDQALAGYRQAREDCRK